MKEMEEHIDEGDGRTHGWRRWGNTLMEEMGEHIDEGDGGTH